MTDHLLREHAPNSDRGLGLIEEEATRQLKAALAAHRLVSFAPRRRRADALPRQTS